MASCSKRSGNTSRRRRVEVAGNLGDPQLGRDDVRSAASRVAAEPRHFIFRYRSPQHFLDTFRAYYGPVHKAFEALDAVGDKALAHDIVDLVGRFNRSADETMVVPSEYLEVIITKR